MKTTSWKPTKQESGDWMVKHPETGQVIIKDESFTVCDLFCDRKNFGGWQHDEIQEVVDSSAMNTQQTAKHTPGPWSFNGAATISAESKFIAVVAIDKRYTLLEIPEVREQQANAEFIVRACNSHDELVGVVNELVAWLGKSPEQLRSTPNALTSIMTKVNAVLTSAQGKEN